MPTSIPDTVQRRALVLYGSETGNAQAAAEELLQLVRRLHFTGTLQELDAVDPPKLNEANLVLIAVSTTGQGDLPRNAKVLWRKLLRKRLPPTHLSRMRFALFGIGDSSYPKFNYASLKLRKRLLQLGAQEIATKAEADERHEEGSDTIFLPWKDKLRQRLLELYPLQEGLEPIPDGQLLQPPWLLGSLYEPDVVQSTRSSTRPGVSLHRSTLVSNDRITPDDHWQDVRHLTFESGSPCPYGPGDILAIYPHNPLEDVQKVIDMLGWEDVADKSVSLVINIAHSPLAAASAPSIHPKTGAARLSIRSILTECVDLNAIPKRSFFSLIAHFTNDEVQKLRLVEFADPQYTDELFDYTTRPRRSTLEVLQEFDTVKIPWQWLLEVFPVMRARQFSIASGGGLKVTAHGNARFELLVAIVRYKTVIRKIRRGICTQYLSELQPGAELDLELIKGSLGITEAQASTPLLMIGPGTGVAPMRSLIWERASWGSVNGGSLSLKPALLFFGCRNEKADYFFRDEWPLLKDAASLQVQAAFSRDQQQKVYVQDLIRIAGDQIFDMMYNKQGIICVCGSSGKMPEAVRLALVDVLHKNMDNHRSEAEAYFKNMESEARYRQETW